MKASIPLRSAALALALVVCGAAPGRSHETRPAYLEVRETGPGTYRVLWKVPAREGLRLGIHAVLPPACASLGEPVAYTAASYHVERGELSCPGGLDGQTIAVDGLAGTLTDVLVRVERSGMPDESARLTPARPALVVTAEPSWLQVASSYIGLGVEHILLGPDHLLFVLALLLLVRSGRRLAATVTAFTLAHSLTLAAATLDLVRLPQAPIEAVIALSIVFVAAEVIEARRGRPSLAARRPWLLAFAFGLLHGFGFAGALAEVGLPARSIPLALLSFNAGVELGQLAFLAAAGVLALAALRLLPRAVAHAPVALAYGIGSVSAYWTLERVAALGTF